MTRDRMSSGSAPLIAVALHSIHSHSPATDQKLRPTSKIYFYIYVCTCVPKRKKDTNVKTVI